MKDYSHTISGTFVILHSSKSVAAENKKFVGKRAEVICYNNAGWYDVRVEGEIVKWRGKKTMLVM
jgi:hypothetical protein